MMDGTQEMIAKDGVEEETVAAVQSLAGKYKYGKKLYLLIQMQTQIWLLNPCTITQTNTHTSAVANTNLELPQNPRLAAKVPLEGGQAPSEIQ